MPKGTKHLTEEQIKEIKKIRGVNGNILDLNMVADMVLFQLNTPILSRKWAIKAMLEMGVARDEEAAQSLYTALYGFLHNNVESMSASMQKWPLWPVQGLLEAVMDTAMTTPLRALDAAGRSLYRAKALSLYVDGGMSHIQDHIVHMLSVQGKAVHLIPDAVEWRRRIRRKGGYDPLIIVAPKVPMESNLFHIERWEHKRRIVIAYNIKDIPKTWRNVYSIQVSPHRWDGIYSGISVLATIATLLEWRPEQE